MVISEGCADGIARRLAVRQSDPRDCREGEGGQTRRHAKACGTLSSLTHTVKRWCGSGTIPMAKDYKSIYAALSEKLKHQAAASGIYSHAGAKGDAREDLVRELLERQIGSSYGVAKAEIIDSVGRSSAQHDVVIFEQDVAACLDADGGRRIVTVESVVMVVEVKSTLSAAESTLAEERKHLSNLALLRRWYQPSPLLAAAMRSRPHSTNAEIEAFVRDGVGARDEGPGDGNMVPIVVAYFGFNGFSDAERAGQFARELEIEIVSTLDGATVARADDGSYPTYGSGVNSLGAFLGLVRSTLENSRRTRAVVYPNAARYVSPEQSPSSATSGSSSSAS